MSGRHASDAAHSPGERGSVSEDGASEGGPRPLPLRLRVALLYAALLLAIIAVIGSGLIVALDRAMRDLVDDGLRLRAATVAAGMAVGDDERLDAGDVDGRLLTPGLLDDVAAPGIYAQVLDRNGEVVASSQNVGAARLPASPTAVAGALAGQHRFETTRVMSDEVRLLVRPIDGADRPAGVVVVGRSLQLVNASRQETHKLVLIGAVLAALAALAGGRWLTTRVLGPVSDVTRVARRIAATGRFDRRIARGPANDELSELAATFDEMLARLDRTFRAQRDFLADASHELRGPLMVIRGNLDLLRMGVPEPDRSASIREASEGVERLSRLATDLLFLAAVDATATPERGPVDLAAMAARAWERARLVDAGAHELRLGRADPVMILGDASQLEALVWNLLENALRYTPPGGRIGLAVRAADPGPGDGGPAATGEGAEVVVSDAGIGIPAEHLPRLFERFYRVDRARSRVTGGTGLGLAIVARGAEAHGGRGAVRSAPGEGSHFTVWLPPEPG